MTRTKELELYSGEGTVDEQFQGHNKLCIFERFMSYSHVPGGKVRRGVTEYGETSGVIKSEVVSVIAVTQRNGETSSLKGMNEIGILLKYCVNVHLLQNQSDLDSSNSDWLTHEGKLIGSKERNGISSYGFSLVLLLSELYIIQLIQLFQVLPEKILLKHLRKYN